MEIYGEIQGMIWMNSSNWNIYITSYKLWQTALVGDSWRPHILTMLWNLAASSELDDLHLSCYGRLNYWPSLTKQIVSPRKLELEQGEASQSLSKTWTGKMFIIGAGWSDLSWNRKVEKAGWLRKKKPHVGSQAAETKSELCFLLFTSLLCDLKQVR